MPAALEAVDLAALLAEALAWALLTVTVVLLGKLVAVMGREIDFGLFTIRPLGWLADALRSYVLAGAEDARQAVAGAMKATFDGLVWGFDVMLRSILDVAQLTKGAILYLWGHALAPFIHSITDPIRKLAAKADAAVTALEKTVVKDFNLAKAWATQEAGRAISTTEAFTTREVTAARRDAAAATAKISSYVHASEATAEALPGTIAGDFDSLWDELRKVIRPDDLAKLLSAGLLSGMLLRVLAQEAGLDTAQCRDKHKQVCETDPLKWASFLEGLALLGFGFNFRQLVAFAEGLAHDVKPFVEAAK